MAMNFPLENSGMLAVLVAGFFFGYFLEVSGLGSPRKLTAQFTLRDWSVFKVMFVAIVVAAAGLWLFAELGWLRFEALKVQTPFYWAMAIGGALLGAGMAIGGYCPGTSVVGLFTGRLDALVFMLGILIGTTLFAANFDALQALYLAAKGPKGLTLAALTGLPTWLILLLLAGLAAGGFRLGAWFERRHGGPLRAKELSE
jgi:hypothetical protein